MTIKLNVRQRRALDYFFHENRDDFTPAGVFSGVGDKTIESLAAIGFLESGISRRHHGLVGWRMTETAWQFLYEKESRGPR